MRSPIHDWLVAAGARFDAASTLDEPLDFGDPAGEYAVAREAVAIFDRSLATKIEVRGGDRVRFLHNLCTNDIKGLALGRGCEAFVTNVQAKIIGHVRIWADADSHWIDVVPGAAAALLAHLDRYIITERVELFDRTAEFARVLVFGPRAEQLVVAISGMPSALGDLEICDVSSEDEFDLRILRDDSLGSPCFDLQGRVASSNAFRSALRRAGEPLGARLIGRAAYDALRIEAGLPEYGRDMSDANLPQEVGRDARAISFTKGCYLGQETVARIDAMGHVNRKLVGLALPDQSAALDHGAEISVGEKPVGLVTSSAFSPRFGHAVALGYVRRGNEKPGTELVADGTRAIVRSLPFSTP